MKFWENNFSVANRLLNTCVVQHIYAWLENCRTEDMITLYIRMELCDKTLQQIINDNKSGSNLKAKETLTSMGYYISSQLFIEILECVQYLHNQQIIRRPQSV